MSQPKTGVQELFDGLAAEYRQERDKQLSFLAQKRIVLEMLSGLGGRLLEVGCGPAPMVDELLARNFEVHGIDVSPEMIRQAQYRMAGHPLARRCEFRVADVEHLPYGDASFDVVVAMGVIEYLPSYGRALQEMRRVLKPGGHVVLTVPNRASLYHAAYSSYLTIRRLCGVPRRIPFIPNRCTPWSL